MKAMLLAAGLGTRMRPLTEHTPKPLLPVAGRPLIEHHVVRLAAAGFVELVINCSHLGEQIEAYLGDGSAYGVRIAYSREMQPLETGGGIFRALPLLGGEPFLVISTDIWTDYPLVQLLNMTPPRGHLVMVDNPGHLTRGDFHAQSDGTLTEQGSAPRLTYSGLSVLHPELFEGCADGVFPLRPLFARAMAEGLLTYEHYRGQWLDVGTPERLREADALARS
jgi:N-acetyl-alpha-D-muramate 1-phosphate uridylyltransferase